MERAIRDYYAQLQVDIPEGLINWEATRPKHIMIQIQHQIQLAQQLHYWNTSPFWSRILGADQARAQAQNQAQAQPQPQDRSQSPIPADPDHSAEQRPAQQRRPTRELILEPPGLVINRN
ncbi:unnamed protein product [Caenorhabditis auriculariae]|uniref:Uncharacterized protein n=1 Tax=Caenorhabditis auriculariae TaxID=2777116 RepID=A0A8S1HIX7_9PELO|nr:unnamed protein product [Caenorhabditis auriculariae]